MKRTPLYNAHVAARARLVDFASWEMPLQYSGVVDEYYTVRNAAGLFDVSHMGRLVVRGPNALAFLQQLTTNNVASLQPLQSQYSMVCNSQGGIKDDVFVYKVASEEYLVCVNASNREKLAGWFRGQAGGFTHVQIEDRSGQLAQLALQGPRSKDLLTELGLQELAAIKPRHCLQTTLDGVSLLVTRTGYTGEQGYELYVPSADASALWDQMMAVGKAAGVKPAGLGARDLLRLDMAYLLYGNDISEDTTPLEAGAASVVNFEKGDFVGREALHRQQQSGLTRRLVAFELLEKAVPRHGFCVVASGAQHDQLGNVTSGNLSPMLQKGIGLAYVPLLHSSEGTRFSIDIRGKLVPAIVVNPPFYKKKP